jgi:NhaA family Na+:H+ antiporter
MATDIAFALGVLALLGSRVPVALKVFLTALAIADDLIAVIVIGLFYSGDLSTAGLSAAAVVIFALLVANRLGVRRPVVYAVLGLALWVAVLQSGIHATIAGVLLAITIPSRTRLDATAFQVRSQYLVETFSGRARDASTVEHQHAALWELEEAAEQAQAPMLRIEHALQPWVSFLIVPLFALANAGVVLRGDLGAMLAEPVVLGVMGGLVLGKQVGITAAAWVVVRSGLAILPDGVSWRHIYGAGWLGGIGFTMSLFVAELAYGPSPSLSLAKVAILSASIVAGLGGYLVLSSAGKPASPMAPLE